VPAVVRQFLATFKRRSAEPASSFSIDQLVEKMQRSFAAVPATDVRRPSAIAMVHGTGDRAVADCGRRDRRQRLE
jgi:hypothetical protein